MLGRWLGLLWTGGRAGVWWTKDSRSGALEVEPPHPLRNEKQVMSQLKKCWVDVTVLISFSSFVCSSHLDARMRMECIANEFEKRQALQFGYEYRQACRAHGGRGSNSQAVFMELLYEQSSRLGGWTDDLHEEKNSREPCHWGTWDGQLV